MRGTVHQSCSAVSTGCSRYLRARGFGRRDAIGMDVIGRRIWSMTRYLQTRLVWLGYSDAEADYLPLPDNLSTLAVLPF